MNHTTSYQTQGWPRAPLPRMPARPGRKRLGWLHPTNRVRWVSAKES